MAAFPTALLALIAVVTSVSFSAFVAYGVRHRTHPGAPEFASFAGVMVVAPLAVFVAAELLAVSAWINVPSLLFMPYALFWLLFALAYTGWRTHLSKTRLALVSVPPVVGAGTLIIATAMGLGIVSSTDTGILYAVFLTTVMFGFALLFSGVVLLVRAGYAYVSADRGPALALAVGATLPVVLPFVFGPVLSSGPAPPGSYLLAYLLSIVPFGVAIARYDFFESAPVAEAIGRDAVVAEMEEAMVLVLRDETVVDMNEAATALFDCEFAAVAGEPFDTVVDGGLAAVTELSEPYELDGGDHSRYFEVTVSELTDDDGEPRGQALLFHEVTDRRERNRLERQNERLETFASIVSHDLRNPLGIAAGYLELARESGDEAAFDTVEDALDRMDGMIADLLTMARAETVVTEPESIDLEVLVTEAWQTAQTDGATLQCLLREDVTVDGDPDLLRNVFENLFRNAAEHGSPSPDSHTRQDAAEHGSPSPDSHTRQDAAEHGSPSPDSHTRRDAVDRSDSRVTVTVGEIEDAGGFYVEDDGTGIPPDERADVFDHGYTTSETGTGFGLSIVGDLVRAHDWEIAVTESEDGGARFEIYTA
jgi:signal transduction histidine kinase